MENVSKYPKRIGPSLIARSYPDKYQRIIATALIYSLADNAAIHPNGENHQAFR
jgi:hypothetical protein